MTARSAAFMNSSWLGTFCVIGAFGRVISTTGRTLLVAFSRLAPTSNCPSTTAGGGITVTTTVFLNTRPDVSLRTL
jgi:hypothetical protein